MADRLKYVIFLACILSFAGCKPHEEVMQYGSLYGIVVDKTTGEPVRSAGVELQPLGLKIVTGDDGQFEFVKVEEGTYNLLITKTGYNDYKSNDIMVKGNSEGKPVNIQIEKIPPSLRIVDEDGKDIREINFGDSKDDLLRTFSIFNDGENVLNWQITKTVDWIKQIRPDEGTLMPGETQSVILSIDRSLLAGNKNETTIHITSNSGSRQLTISATGVTVASLDVPIIYGIDYSKAKIHVTILDVGIPAYTECGVVLSTNHTPTTDNALQNVCIPFDENKQHKYYELKDLRPRTQYFIRAYAINDVGTAYSKEVSFTTSTPTLPIFVFLKDYHVYENGLEMIGLLAEIGEPQVLQWGFLVSNNKTDCPNLKEDEVYNTYYHTNSGSLPKIGFYTKTASFDKANSSYRIIAYAITQHDTIYDNCYEIETHIPFITINNLAVAYEDEIYFEGYEGRFEMTHYEAENICNNLVIGKYDDWRLPTLDELKFMYENRNTLGGFKQDIYWSSTKNKEDPEHESSAWDNGYATLDFATGETRYCNPYVEYNFYVRPVRTNNSVYTSNILHYVKTSKNHSTLSRTR